MNTCMQFPRTCPAAKRRAAFGRSAPITFHVSALSLFLIVALSVAGCTAPDRRFERLTELATSEVRTLPSALDRLGRFLQIADLQQVRGVQDRAKSSRADARVILEDAPKDDLPLEPQLAGWISLAELSRQAESADESRLAGERAHALLLTLEPPAQRVPYVRSLAQELRQSQGEAAVVALYVLAADWASTITGPRKRRTAYMAIAHSLVDLNEVEKAASVIGRDTESPWRAQALIALAGGSMHFQYSSQKSAFQSPWAGSTAARAPEGGYYSQQSSLGLTPAIGDIPALGATTALEDEDFSWKAIDYGSYFRAK